MHLYLDALRAHREELDSLNVYPVPDGDTGTNLMQTQQAVVSALEPVPRDAGLQSLGVTISRASLTGARGNSGVILSQVLRGLTEALPDGHPAGGPKIVAALEDGVRPWVRPWNAEHAAGRITRPLRHNGQPYTGINILSPWASPACKASPHRSG